jgi:hypothetical protein
MRSRDGHQDRIPPDERDCCFDISMAIQPNRTSEGATIAAMVADSEIGDVIRQHAIDFLDFGCSQGASLAYGEETFGGRRGLGIDLSPSKVEIAIASGHRAVVGDATQLMVPDRSVDFVLMVHFLEHLPTFKAAQQSIASAIRVAKEFVYIRHPWFDADAELFRLGYKMFWSDWIGHRLHFDSLSFVKALSRLGFEGRWCLMGRSQIRDTRHDAIIPLFAKTDSFQVPVAEAARRRPVTFAAPVFREIACILQTGSIERFEAARARLDARHVTLLEVVNGQAKQP